MKYNVYSICLSNKRLHNYSESDELVLLISVKIKLIAAKNIAIEVTLRKDRGDTKHLFFNWS